ncbi:MAG: endonuclease/exonuclease/phosphatase family protein [Planctomycetota bacterium]|nr:MAG: endonuclease/exonuclease/phosphatase family protein [Planctomycetota bacterium]
MSYNIRYLNSQDGQDVWANRRETVVATIQQADLVGLQEVVAQQLQDIESGTQGAGFDWYGVGREDGATAGEMTAVGWRSDRVRVLERGTFWLSPTPDVPGSRGWDAALPRIASWIRAQPIDGGPEFYFVNTHFDHRGSAARENSARLLRRWVTERAGRAPVIVTGDFNATEHDAPIRTLLGDGSPLRDARKLSPLPDPGPNSTWNGFRQIVDGRRIDFIFVTDRVTVLEFRTLDPRTPDGRFGSDHLPVWARVRLLDSPAEP